MQWVTDIVLALRLLGGEASPKQIGRKIQLIRKEKMTTNWEACIRAALQAYCAGAKQYRKGNANLFRHPQHGVWAMRKFDSTVAAEKMPKDDLRGLALQRMSTDELSQMGEAAREDQHKFIALLDEKAQLVKLELLSGKSL